MTKETFLGIDDLAGKGVPFKRAQIYRKIREGTFPHPVHFGPRRTAWVESDIDKWLADRIAERVAAPRKHRKGAA